MIPCPGSSKFSWPKHPIHTVRIWPENARHGLLDDVFRVLVLVAGDQISNEGKTSVPVFMKQPTAILEVPLGFEGCPKAAVDLMPSRMRGLKLFLPEWLLATVVDIRVNPPLLLFGKRPKEIDHRCVVQSDHLETA
jgi:hypothetical protein